MPGPASQRLSVHFAGDGSWASMGKYSGAAAQAGAPAADYTSRHLFIPFAAEATAATLSEPYLAAEYQLQNLRAALAAMIQGTQIRRASISTGGRSRRVGTQLHRLEQGTRERSTRITIALLQDLHTAELGIDNSVIACCKSGWN